MHFWGTKLQFLSPIYTIGSNFWANTSFFSVKSTNFSIFNDQMYILGYQSPVFIPNLYNRVKILGKNFIFSIKSTSVFIFRDQMYILGYQTPVFIPQFVQSVDIFGQKLHFQCKKYKFFHF